MKCSNIETPGSKSTKTSASTKNTNPDLSLVAKSRAITEKMTKALNKNALANKPTN